MKNELNLRIILYSFLLHIFILVFASFILKERSPVRIFIKGDATSTRFWASRKHLKSIALVDFSKKRKRRFALNKKISSKVTKKFVPKTIKVAQKTKIRVAKKANFVDEFSGKIAKNKKIVKQQKQVLLEEQKMLDAEKKELHKKEKQSQAKSEEVKKIETAEKEEIKKIEQKTEDVKPLQEDIKPQKEEIKQEVADITSQEDPTAVEAEVSSEGIGSSSKPILGREEDLGVNIEGENIDFATAERFSKEFGGKLRAVRLFREFNMPVKFLVCSDGKVNDINFPKNVGTKVDQVAIIRALRQIDFAKDYPDICGREMFLVFNRNKKGKISIGGDLA
ncbi:TPA: hypothetical protein DEO28_00810 [Candidatus Dependentiae bacterium]|nr:MAG: hypothetical protein UR14_C0003G0014 [candidate division TM6 bacterium GW2011_GWE2_31_21]KKP54134.1 MAG: hypothetical protein UR43_C0001G0152 [candidate division TM6 bacterium GW2011_GWF2_33_332]HBS47855.1 hypothetical protein [Candidatus Dependentiae bacterium]HBZ73040.1 hypothetical protein [Candidatus Dependentiae bacterium]